MIWVITIEKEAIKKYKALKLKFFGQGAFIKTQEAVFHHSLINCSRGNLLDLTALLPGFFHPPLSFDTESGTMTSFSFSKSLDLNELLVGFGLFFEGVL